MEALEKGILYICNKYKNYNNLNVNEKINLKSEISYYWNKFYNEGFQKHIKPVFGTKKDEKLEEFVNWECLFAKGL